MRAHKKPAKLQKLFRICKFWHYFFPDICYFVHSCNQFADKFSLSFVPIRLTYSAHPSSSDQQFSARRCSGESVISLPHPFRSIVPFSTHFHSVFDTISNPYRNITATYPYDTRRITALFSIL